ncbi:hypothetical protein RRG08_033896 [Elysia crispata]|uniref:Uncharacterized protein n=1 Tax=Elysia crispata TaxID=231223 RepID=A0AAE1BAA2_9GAST|nr:hypothetical protein RRG08_033896 [Elysia crispata]
MAVTTGLHSDYIKMTVGPILVHCLKEVSEIQPKDPIDYIARWLYNQNNNLLLYHRKIKDIVKYDQAKLQVAAEDKNRKTKIKKLKHSLSDIKKESNSLEVEIEEALWHRQQILKETCIALAAKRNVQLNTYQDDQMRSLEALLASKIKRSAKKHKPVRILLPTLGKTSTSSISRSEEEEEMTSSESETSSFEESEDEDSDESEEEEDEQDSNESDEVERTESQQRADKQMKIKEEQQQIKTLKKALGEGKTLDLKNLLLLKKFLTKTTKGDKKKVRRASSLPSIFSTVSKGGAVEKSNKMDIVKPGHHELKIKHKTLVPQGRMGIRPPKRKKPTILPSTKEVQGESAVPEIASSPPLPRPHSPETDVHSDPNYYLSTDNADSYELFKKSSSFLELMEEEHAEPEKTIPENILLDKTSLHKKKGKRKPRELKTEDARGISEYASEETTSKIFIATSQTSAPDIPEEDFQRSEIEDFSKSDISLTKTEKRQVLGRMKKASAHKDETTRVETVKISQRESSLSSTDEESLEDLEEGMGSEEGEMVEEVDEKMKLRSKKGKTLKKPSRRSILKIVNDELASRHVPEKKSKKMAGKSESRHVKKSREKVYTEETRDVTSEQKDLGAEFIKRDSPVSGESTSISSHTPTIQRSQESLYSDLEELTAAADMEWEDTELRDTVTYEKYERTRIVDSKGEMVERKTDEYPESVIRSSKEKSRESPQIDKAGRLEKKQRQQLVPQFVTWRCTWRQQLVCEHPTLGDMVPRPPLLTRENVDWWENQDFTPEVLFDHEIYTRKNDDEVGGDESTSLRLTLQDFVGPGTSVAAIHCQQVCSKVMEIKSILTLPLK